MRNPVVGTREVDDLKKQVQKVLRGLGNPEPPLDLRDVRELLKLDVRYYSSSDDSFLRDTVSKIKIAGKQLAARPTLLLDVVKKAKLSALWVPDRKRILIDSGVPELKHRWLEGHEIGHSIIPWHQRFLFGDDGETLKHSCHEVLEAEANYASGQLLFLQDRFTREANDLSLTLKSVRKLKENFGNTMTSTLWRFIEEAHPDRPMVGIVSQHPHKTDSEFDAENPCKYLIESPSFRERFSETNPVALFDLIKGYSRRAKGGPLGSGEMLLDDKNGEKHVYIFESFSNTYEVLTLGVYDRPAKKLISLAMSKH